MPEAQMPERIADAAEKGGSRKELFAALQSAVEADLDAFLSQRSGTPLDFETLVQTVRRRALATADRALEAARAQRS